MARNRKRNNTLPGKSSKAVLYARVSSKDQEREGYSIPSQLKLLHEYAREKGLTVVDEYIDVETAKAAGRTRFGEMLRYLKDQKRVKPESACSTVLVEKTDRLYRNIKDWVTLDELDVVLIFVKENFTISRESRSSEKLMHGFRVVMAKNYVDNLSEESKKGMLEKAQQGVYPQMAPFGYMNVELNGKRGIVPNPDESKAVVRLFEWYATGKYSLKELTATMNKQVLPKLARKSRFPKASIHEWLRNPFYYGDFVWKDQYYSGKHEPLISRELFDKVQSVLDHKGSGGAHYMKHSWLLQGLVRCGHCGCAMTAERKKGKYIYYHCTKNKGNCPAAGYVREEDLEEAVQQSLADLHLPESLVAYAKAVLKTSFQAERREHSEAVDKLEKKRALLEHRLEGLYEDKLDGQISEDSYLRKKQEWRQEQAHIEELLAKHRRADRRFLDQGELLINLMQQLPKRYAEGTFEEKRLILETIHSNRFWANGLLTVKYREPFAYLASLKTAVSVSGGNREKLKDVLPRTDSNHQPTG